MEQLMPAQVKEANGKLRAILAQVRDGLAGRQDITCETIRDILQQITQLAPVASQAAALRGMDPALDSSLETYADNLSDLQDALEQVRFMLLARQSSLEASRSHLETVNRWATAFQQTR
jgi:hypothetical protein